MKQLKFVNIHTHHSVQSNEIGIRSISPDELPVGHQESGFIACGIHPWHIPPEWDTKHWNALEELWQQPQTLAIGECGLDFLCSQKKEIQEEVFFRQAQCAARYRKPMIIHCVKAFDSLIRIYKILKPDNPWIIHGFRGKPEQLNALIRLGFYISFGPHHNISSTRICPEDRFFIETDDTQIPIEKVYTQISGTRKVSMETLQTAQINNLKKIFKIQDAD